MLLLAWGWHTSWIVGAKNWTRQCTVDDEDDDEGDGDDGAKRLTTTSMANGACITVIPNDSSTTIMLLMMMLWPHVFNSSLLSRRLLLVIILPSVLRCDEIDEEAKNRKNLLIRTRSWLLDRGIKAGTKSGSRVMIVSHLAAGLFSWSAPSWASHSAPGLFHHAGNGWRSSSSICPFLWWPFMAAKNNVVVSSVIGTRRPLVVRERKLRFFLHCKASGLAVGGVAGKKIRSKFDATGKVLCQSCVTYRPIA
jgi:hypothetical protein